MKLPPVSPQYPIARPGVLTPKTRKAAFWYFDFAFVSFKVLVEIDGGIFRPGGGAHSHPVDITRNMSKQNDAALAGFVTLRFTPQEVKSGHAIAFTQKMLCLKGWTP
jgi:very-short-patch-repair endonuclease